MKMQEKKPIDWQRAGEAVVKACKKGKGTLKAWQRDWFFTVCHLAANFLRSASVPCGQDTPASKANSAMPHCSRAEQSLRGLVLTLVVCSLMIAAVLSSCDGTTGSLPPAATTGQLATASAAPPRPTATPRPTPPGLADLVPVPDASGSFCRFDAQGNFTLTIKNQGTGDAGLSTTEVQYTAKLSTATGTEFASGTVMTTTAAIAAGHALDLSHLSFTLLVGQPGLGKTEGVSKTLTMTVNVNREVVESDYTNNTVQVHCR